MKWNDVPLNKVMVTGDLKGEHALDQLQEKTTVQFACFIRHVSIPRLEDLVEFRIRICKVEANAHTNTTLSLCISGFENQPLRAIKGNVIVPAQKLFEWPSEPSHDSREIALRAVLYSELQEIRFDLCRKKSTCSLWFRCLRDRPLSLVPQQGLDNYFEAMPY